MSVQLVLGVQLPASATLTAFVGRTNAEAKAAVGALVGGQSERLYLAGPAHCGKTHLLQAACRAISEAGQRSVYLPLSQVSGSLQPLLEGLADMDCVCIDDIDAIAGNREDEIALIGLTDQLRTQGGRLLAAGATVPDNLGLALPDLASRLGWGGVITCKPLDDEDKCHLLIRRAEQRGMELPESTARWILRHVDTHVPGLMVALDTLDRASLSAHRRLTIPFVKEVLEGQ